ncbi:fimbrial tip adhesin FimD, partial [Bacteroides sp.]|uniref:fimbrial tip adhesin FimD n=1 Tax=Bacteroides sp. TaxID=29523 RepID=UPI002FC7DBCE
GNETYLLIAIDWRKQTDGITKTYYYRIPFSYIRATGDVAANRDKIRRNYVYQFAVNVTRLGGLDPAEAVDVSANFDLLDWSTKKVEVSILEYHFLFVYNPNVEIYNRYANVWEYKSSKHPITVTMTKVYCNEYDTDGGINERIYTSGDPQYPTVTESKIGDRTYFTFQSMIPINYVPLYIKATVTNGTGLSANVSLTIYPKIYVTASYSYGGYVNQLVNPDDRGIIPANRAYQDKDGERIWLAGSYTTPSGTLPDAGSNNPNGNVADIIPQKNFNFFTVHVTSLDIEDEHNGMTIGDPTNPLNHKGSTSGSIDNRDAVVTGQNLSDWSVVSPYFQTQTDMLHNKMVSPQFVIATQRGITLSTKSWEVAQQRCATYRESQYAAGSWRMPTLSELKLVRRIQLDPNSAIKELFQSKTTGGADFGWWTAEYGSSIILGEPNEENAIRINQPQQSNSVRCVRDVWRD